MYRNDKRHSHGTLLPNLYFSLQIVIVLLILSLIMQFVELLNLGLPVVLMSLFASMILIMYFLIRRKRVIQRQDLYHSEEKH